MSWERLAFRGWKHDSGWMIHHCGHPTANWPYYLVAPKTGHIVLAQNGHGFRTSALAKDAVRAILAGYYKVKDNRVVRPGD
jgi:hypothetical protein